MGGGRAGRGRAARDGRRRRRTRRPSGPRTRARRPPATPAGPRSARRSRRQRRELAAQLERRAPAGRRRGRSSRPPPTVTVAAAGGGRQGLPDRDRRRARWSRRRDRRHRRLSSDRRHGRRTPTDAIIERDQDAPKLAGPKPSGLGGARSVRRSRLRRRAAPAQRPRSTGSPTCGSRPSGSTPAAHHGRPPPPRPDEPGGKLERVGSEAGFGSDETSRRSASSRAGSPRARAARAPRGKALGMPVSSVQYAVPQDARQAAGSSTSSAARYYRQPQRPRLAYPGS